MKPSEFVILTAVLASGIYTMLAKSGLAFFHITLIAVLAAIVFRMSAIHWRWHEIMPGGGSFVYFIFSFHRLPFLFANNRHQGSGSPFHGK